MPNNQLTPEDRQKFTELASIFMPHATQNRRRRYPKGERTAKFVHYTSADSAIKIIDSRRIWMRNTQCMADYREVSHGHDMLLHAKEKLDELVRELDQIAPNAAQGALQQYDSAMHNIRFSTYVASVSEHDPGDDPYGKLSMWRAFGNNAIGRVALVFSVPWLADATSELKVIFSPVAYLNKQDVTVEIDNIIHLVRERNAFLREVPPLWIYGTFFVMLLAAVTCTKHRGFIEEREWRVIYSPLVPGMRSELIEQETQCVFGVPQLVQKLPIDGRVPAAAEIDFTRMFDHLIIGPSQYSMPIAHACIEALGRAGISDAAKRIIISDIPIRT